MQHPTSAESSSYVRCHDFLLNQNPSCEIFISVFQFSFPSKYSKSNKKTVPVFFPITNVMFASQTRSVFPSVFTLYPLIVHFLLDRTLRHKIYAKLWCPQNIFYCIHILGKVKNIPPYPTSETIEGDICFPKT